MGISWGNVAVDAADPARLGRWWAEAFGVDVVEDEPGVVSLRPLGPGGPWLDLVEVPEAKSVKNRLHLDVRPDEPGDEAQAREVARLLAMGATRADVGQGDVPWVVLADPEGNEFCVLQGLAREEA